MGTSANWLSAFEHVQNTRVVDAVTLARRVMMDSAELDSWLEEVPPSWEPLPDPPKPDMAYVDRLLEQSRSDPDHPLHWHRRAVNAQLAKPQAAQTYLKIRRALWNWPEFAGLCRRARIILEVVVELLRDEAFPWFLPVPAEDVRKLARVSLSSFIRSVHELELLAMTRPGRLASVASSDGVPQFPGMMDLAQPARPIAQWVLRYARGIPWSSKRAAWWLNYDLLCETGRVLPCFAMEIDQLPKTYRSRNRPMGPQTICTGRPSHPEMIKVFERSASKGGPMAPPGLRAALWEPSAPE